MNTVTIRLPDDFHLHLRQGEMLRAVLPHTLRWARRAIIMPNLRPEPVTDAVRLKHYRDEILVVVKDSDFEPLMTIQMTDATTPRVIKKAEAAGAIGAKVYPIGVTTNSENGVRDIRNCTLALHEMEGLGMVLLIHAEVPGVFTLEREAEYRSILDWLVENFPKLRIVVEHVTDWRMVARVISLPETVAATVTVHHLCLTLDDVLGGELKPHHFCKPVAKRPEDLAALRNVVFGGNRKFFLGTDSAPHLRGAKECASGCAGVFSAPVAMPILATLFEEFSGSDWIRNLERFTSVFGAQFYGLPVNDEQLTLTRSPWRVAEELAGVVPFRAGEELQWQVG